MADTMIDVIGGEDALRALVERFYDLMETLPETVHLRHLHYEGHGLDHARVEQFDFLSGFMGGRRHYEERHGHMDVRMVHDHVPIRPQDAESWLACMDQALAGEGLTGPEIDKAARRVPPGGDGSGEPPRR